MDRYPWLRNHFSFQNLNRMQQQCLPIIMDTRQNMVVSAPTSTGKTVLFQLAILKQQRDNPNFRSVYLAPIKCLCQQKTEQWSNSFRDIKVSEMTADNLDEDVQGLQFSQLIVATPEKLDSITRRLLAKMQFNLLLLDEIHMLNIENRGATLEAVVTRIKTLNPMVRIIAASATIPNINEVSAWLSVSKEATKVFGEEYRPVKIIRHVLGYKPHKNAFIFERILNSKLPDVIIKYSEQKPALVFCQTQSGTVSACQMLINTLPRDYIINNDKQMTTLVTRAKQLNNQSLRNMVPCGIAFHNASLNYQDRRIVQELFIAGHIRIICTTSTLSMGVNLPARLVVIKSTICYRGAERGYEEYSRAEIEQIVGRAGRVQYETQGIAVIMTTINNIQKYQENGKLQPLQSQLLPQLKEHINAEIALRTVSNLNSMVKYLQGTFMYVRMSNHPQNYAIKNKQSIGNFLLAKCTETINDLTQHEIIKFNQQTKEVIPLEICVELSRSYISVETAKKLIDSSYQIKSLRKFLMIICQATQIKRYRSKLDERKCLKALNECIPFKLKETIGTSDKKAFVLLQAHLGSLQIQNWQLRKQSSEICYFLRSLCYLARKIYNTRKVFTGVVFSQLMVRNFQIGNWEYNNLAVMNQIPLLKGKIDFLKAENVDNIEKLNGLIKSRQICRVCRQNGKFAQSLQIALENYNKFDFKQQIEGDFIQITITMIPQIANELRGISLYIGDKNNNLILNRFTRTNNINEISKGMCKVRLNLCPAFLVIIKQGIIGFDSIYRLERNGSFSIINELTFEKQDQKPRRHTVSPQKSKPQVSSRAKSAVSRRKNLLVALSQKPKESIQELPEISDGSNSQQQRSKKLTASRVPTPAPILEVQPLQHCKPITFKKQKQRLTISEFPKLSPDRISFQPSPKERPVKPIQSYMERMSQFASKYSTNPRTKLAIFQSPVEGLSQKPLIQTPQTAADWECTSSSNNKNETFKPKLKLTQNSEQQKQSAYDYFKNMMSLL